MLPWHGRVGGSIPPGSTLPRPDNESGLRGARTSIYRKEEALDFEKYLKSFSGFAFRNKRLV